MKPRQQSTASRKKETRNTSSCVHWFPQLSGCCLHCKERSSLTPSSLPCCDNTPQNSSPARYLCSTTSILSTRKHSRAKGWRTPCAIPCQASYYPRLPHLFLHPRSPRL